MSLTVVNGRKFNDTVLTMSASGWTYDFTFVLYDYNTESLWFPLIGSSGKTQFRSISGHFRDRELSHIPATVTTWEKWVADHPDSKYLDVNSN